jgi:alkylation response protein AidB-like acyl-CoA dehydrogenase
MVSFDPTEEQQMIVAAVRRYAENELRAVYRECDEGGDIPDDVVRIGWEMGLVPGGIPEQYMGFAEEHSALTGALFTEELAWGDLSIAMHLLAPGLLAYPVLLCGTEEQKETYLPQFCDESFKVATAALVEPKIRFDPNALGTTAVWDGKKYTLTGQKAFVPLAADADLFLVYAAEDGTTQGFLVEKGTPGLEVGEREKNMGIHALATYGITLHDCPVARGNRLGGQDGCNFEKLLAYSRVAISAMAVGVARASYEYALAYAKERHAFGEPIASRQAIAFMLAEMAIDIDAARLMVWEAAWRLDKGNDATKEAYLAKMFADDMVMRVTDGGVQVLGGHGYIREHPVELWLRNGRGFAAFEGLAMV